MNLFTFTNRASRSEYWGILISVGILTFLLITGLAAMVEGQSAYPDRDAGVLFALLVVFVISGWIQLAVAARRCTDAAMSKWTMLLFIVPFVGMIYTIVLGCVKPAPYPA